MHVTIDANTATGILQPHKNQTATTLTAGGGLSSATNSSRGVKDLTPVVYSQLDKLYRKHLREQIPEDPSGPPLKTFDAWQAWFQSAESAALAPAIRQDLTLPLSNYYISSSHNTYLSGNQLYGSSTGEAYLNVLQRGCRCLEIDVWNGQEEDSDTESNNNERLDSGSSSNQKHNALSKLKSVFQHKRKNEAQHEQAEEKMSEELEAEEQKDAEQLAQTFSAVELAHRKTLLKHEPRVKHGHTLVKDVPFREVCQAVRQGAFETCTLPVIVSLEVHCNLDQQRLMVEIMEYEWRGCLVDMTGKRYDDITQLPSPEDLRGKFLVKVKWTSNIHPDQESNNPLNYTVTYDDTVDNSQTDSAGASSTVDVHTNKEKASKVLESLAKLGVYTRAYSFKHFTQPEASIPTHVFSLSEKSLKTIHAEPAHGPEMFRHNRDYMVRIYPMNFRVDSSNVDPSFGWRQGAQMVALNWQSLDRGMMLNEGMFSGSEGYVLKPEGYRSSHLENTQPMQKHLTLSIQLLAGQYLPVPHGKDASRLKPYVKFQLHIDTHGPPGQGRVRSRSPVETSYSSNYQDRTLSAGQSPSMVEDNQLAPSETARSSESRHSDSNEDRDDVDKLFKRQSKTGKSPNTDFGGLPTPSLSTSEASQQAHQSHLRNPLHRLRSDDQIVRFASFEPSNELTWSDVPDVIEDLSFLRIKVMDDKTLGKDELIAWSCIRLDRLRTGLRFVHLLDTMGQPTDGVLLMNISKKVDRSS